MVNESICNECFLFQQFLFDNISVNVEQWFTKLKQTNPTNFQILLENLTHFIMKMETDLLFLHKTKLEVEKEKVDFETSQFFRQKQKEAEATRKRQLEEHKTFLESR